MKYLILIVGLLSVGSLANAKNDLENEFNRRARISSDNFDKLVAQRENNAAKAALERATGATVVRFKHDPYDVKNIAGTGYYYTTAWAKMSNGQICSINLSLDGVDAPKCQPHGLEFPPARSRR